MYSNSLVAPWKIGQKTNSNVWLPWNSFYRKSIPMFGLVKHFTENGIRFTENQFPCLVHSNIFWKMEFVLRKINSHVWFVQTFYGQYEMPSNLCGKNACKTIYSLPHRLQTYRDTQHSIVHPLLLPPVQVPLLILLVLPSLMDLFWHKDLNWVIEMCLSLAFWTHLSCSSSKSEGFWSLAVAIKFCYKLVVEEFVAKFASKYTAHCPTTHLRPHQHLSTWAL